MMKSTAAIVRALPIPICTERRGKRDTNPAPSHAPTTEAKISKTSVAGSTATMTMKIAASTIVGSACPTLSVPGILFVGNEAQELKERRRRGERSDAQRIEKIRYEANTDGNRSGERARKRKTLARQREGQCGELHDCHDRQPYVEDRPEAHRCRRYAQNAPRPATKRLSPSIDDLRP